MVERLINYTAIQYDMETHADGEYFWKDGKEYLQNGDEVIPIWKSFPDMETALAALKELDTDE